MNILYTRVSTIEQNIERQLKNIENYNLHVEDKCSGMIPFFNRAGGIKIKSFIEKKQISILSVHQIDRLGRDLADILNTISVCNKNDINIHIVQQGLNTLNEDGTENPISKMIISILGIVAEMERNLIRERQLEGIAIAKERGVYEGRKKGTQLNNLDFLNKPKVKKAIEFLDKGLKNKDVAKIVGLHPNTITKINQIKSIVLTADS